MSEEILEEKPGSNAATKPAAGAPKVNLETVSVEVTELADSVAAKLLDPKHSFIKTLRKLITFPGMFGDTP